MRPTLVLATALAAAVAAAGAAAPATASPGAFPDTIALPDGFQPEGIEAGRGTTLYVGSLADGAVWSGDARTGEGSLLVQGEPGRVAVGVEYDERTDRLWVAGGATGEVRVYDAGTGALLAVYAPGGTGFLNDVAVTRDAVYVTDSAVQQLVVVPTPDGDLGGQASVLPLSGDLQYVAGFNANGVVADPSGRSLLVVQSATGLLFRVDPATGSTQTVDLGGATLVNGDGLFLQGRTLWAVRNQDEVVTEIRLDGDLDAGRVVDELTSIAFDVPTTVTFAAGRLWAVNARFGTVPTPTTTYDVVQVPRT
ncbi:hypothetical protein [Aquipuribacter nitratireducens]|uniref:Superoxide dismutase n=1 Tax=Aquipuribacter nitratireducens TaxID=650104 RepID=A0ABW0GSP5_9MICO